MIFLDRKKQQKFGGNKEARPPKQRKKQGKQKQEETTKYRMYRVSQKKHSYKIFGFGLFVVFWTPLDTDLGTFGLFGRF